MDRLHLMTVFVAVAEEQGFAAAARRLNMSPPAVTRAIAFLEKHLGIKLLIRTTRHVRTTDAGHRYLEDVKRILSEIDAIDQAAAGIHSQPKGELKITAPSLFGRVYVTPLVTDYLNQYPNVSINCVFVDRVTNLIEEGIDLGIRIGSLPDSNLRAVTVGSVRIINVATPDYLKRQGEPMHPQELAKHTLIASTAGSGLKRWKFFNHQESFSPSIAPRLITTTNDSAITACLSGFGITRVLSYQAAPFLASGQLQIILENFEPPAKPIHIIHAQGRNMPTKVRTFIDLAKEKLLANKSLNEI